MTQKLNYKSANIIPQDWVYAKLDLFDNATTEESILDKQKLKLSVSFKKQNNDEIISIRAGLNSPKRHYTRNITNEVMLGGKPHQHYKLCNELYNDIVAELGSECQKIAISKFYESRETYPSKWLNKSIENASAIVYKTNNKWHTMMILEYNVFQFCLDKNLSDKQRIKNMIATDIRHNNFTPKAMTPLSRITNG
jgi:hypothetical protein